MSKPLTTSVTFELEAHVTGTFQPGYPETGPSYSSGGEPGQPPMIEDLEILRLTGQKRLPRMTFDGLGRAAAWTEIDLLDGVDLTSEAAQRLLRNLVQFIGDRAEEDLILEAHEGALADRDARDEAAAERRREEVA